MGVAAFAYNCGSRRKTTGGETGAGPRLGGFIVVYVGVIGARCVALPGGMSPLFAELSVKSKSC